MQVSLLPFVLCIVIVFWGVSVLWTRAIELAARTRDVDQIVGIYQIGRRILQIILAAFVLIILWHYIP